MRYNRLKSKSKPVQLGHFSQNSPIFCQFQSLEDTLWSTHILYHNNKNDTRLFLTARRSRYKGDATMKAEDEEPKSKRPLTLNQRRRGRFSGGGGGKRMAGSPPPPPLVQRWGGDSPLCTYTPSSLLLLLLFEAEMLQQYRPYGSERTSKVFASN